MIRNSVFYDGDVYVYVLVGKCLYNVFVGNWMI